MRKNEIIIFEVILIPKILGNILTISPWKSLAITFITIYSRLIKLILCRVLPNTIIY